jgi:hypothetical protein
VLDGLLPDFMNSAPYQDLRLALAVFMGGTVKE